jgi:predicted ArsR family transcriptional regulator
MPPTNPDDGRLTAQARALGDPTRHAIFRYIGRAARPVGVAELTAHFGFNHNAIRQHLAKLRDAGLLIEATEPPSGRGRPALSYRPVPGAAERWGSPSPYENLAGLLVELLHRGGTPFDVGFDAGVRLATEHGTDLDVIDVVEIVARRFGFEPQRSTRNARVDLVLDRCPFASVAASAPDIVCELHRGLVAGITSGDGGAAFRRLVVRSPLRGGCRIELARTA